MVRCVLKLQGELSQQNQVVESLRVELDTAREAKNEIENHYSDSLKQIETIKNECEEVRKRNHITQVTLFVTALRIAKLASRALYIL